MSTEDTLTSRKKRAIYRSWHRGCKETDLILGNFCDQHIADMNDTELDLFEQFLEEDDAHIWKWITKKLECPLPGYEKLLEDLRNFRNYEKS